MDLQLISMTIVFCTAFLLLGLCISLVYCKFPSLIAEDKKRTINISFFGWLTALICINAFFGTLYLFFSADKIEKIVKTETITQYHGTPIETLEDRTHYKLIATVTSLVKGDRYIGMLLQKDDDVLAKYYFLEKSRLRNPDGTIFNGKGLEGYHFILQKNFFLELPEKMASKEYKEIQGWTIYLFQI